MDYASLTQVVIIQPHQLLAVATQHAPFELTDNEWQAEHRFLNVFSPAAALPEAFFFFAGILLINYRSPIK